MRNLELILFTTVFLKLASACTVTKGYEVHVTNRLPDPMRLHCASGNDDLGFHSTAPNDDFHWSFCDGTAHRTLFFCHLWWHQQNVAFNAFTSKNSDNCLRGKCLWEARPDGIYFSGGEEPIMFSFFYPWANN